MGVHSGTETDTNERHYRGDRGDRGRRGGMRGGRGGGGYHSSHETDSVPHPNALTGGRNSISPGEQAVNGGDGDRSTKHEPGPKEQREGRPPNSRQRGNNNNSSTATVSVPSGNNQGKQSGNHHSGSDSDSKVAKNKLNNSSKVKEHIVNGKAE